MASLDELRRQEEDARRDVERFSFGFDDFFGGQKRETEDFLTSTRQNLGLEGLEQAQQAGVNRLLDIEQQLSLVPEQEKTLTRGFDVNEAQLNKIIETRQTPLRQQATQATSDLTRTEASLANARNQLNLELGILSDRQARETTGYNIEKQAELDSLIDKLNRFETLTDNEERRLQELADQESQFEREKELMEMQLQNDLRVAEFEASLRDSAPQTSLLDALLLLQGDNNQSTQDPFSQQEPQFSPAGGEGTVEGNYIFLNGRWEPLF